MPPRVSEELPHSTNPLLDARMMLPLSYLHNLGWRRRCVVTVIGRDAELVDDEHPGHQVDSHAAIQPVFGPGLLKVVHQVAGAHEVSPVPVVDGPPDRHHCQVCIAQSRWTQHQVVGCHGNELEGDYRNGYVPHRRLTLSSRAMRLRRPRVPDTEGNSKTVLSLFVRVTRDVAALISDLHVLLNCDFDLALRGVLRDQNPTSASTVARLKERRSAELTAASCT